MGQVALKPLTRQDYESIPEGGTRYELINGELIVAPAPNRKHQTVSRNLEYEIFHYLKQNPTGEIYNAPFDVYLSDFDVVQPDLLYVSNQNSKILTNKGVEGGAPDLLVEILSPYSERRDRNIKKSLFTSYGAKEYWLIDPEKEVVEVFYLKKDPNHPNRTLSKEDMLESPLFPELTIALSDVFG